MIRVVVFGMGMVAAHLLTGVERIKRGLEPWGVPLAKYKLSKGIEDIEFVGVYDVDSYKIGRSVYDICREMIGREVPVPETLKQLKVSMGIHLGSMRGMPVKAQGLEDFGGVAEAIDRLVDEFSGFGADIFVNVITTEPAKPFDTLENLERAIEEGRVSASQAYAYAVAKYARKRGRRVAFINVIPTPIARDPAFVELYRRNASIVLGDDGATGATPLTADILEHLAQRNRKVLSIAQFNIGGNTDFLALTFPERNLMKEETKSSIVEDILGYDVPHFIKPTGYLEPLGDKKFVSMHIAWKTFNGLEDELIVNMRINDSPALAGLLVDLIRISAILLEHGVSGTSYEVNAFFMKAPGPRGAKNIARIVAYYNLLNYLKKLGAVSL